MGLRERSEATSATAGLLARQTPFSHARTDASKQITSQQERAWRVPSLVKPDLIWRGGKRPYLGEPEGQAPGQTWVLCSEGRLRSCSPVRDFLCLPQETPISLSSLGWTFKQLICVGSVGWRGLRVCGCLLSSRFPDLLYPKLMCQLFRVEGQSDPVGMKSTVVLP